VAKAGAVGGGRAVGTNRVRRRAERRESKLETFLPVIIVVMLFSNTVYTTGFARYFRPHICDVWVY
jgi:hypothetical protein